MEMESRFRPSAHPRIRFGIAALGAVVLGVAAFFIVRGLAGGDNGGTLKGGPGNAFTISYPKGWKPLPKDQLARLRGSPVAVLRRSDHKGIVIINSLAPVRRDFGKLSSDLDRELKSRIPDFKKVSSRGVSIRAGRALLYSYIRTRSGTVHTLVAVPVDSRGYTLNAVVSAGAADVARQVGAIIRSFDA
jgi:hypothetical protein